MRLLPMLLLACAGTTTDPTDAGEAPTLADVVGVSVSGDAGTYTFAVTVRSPDTGCERYADWWEVVSADGETLIHRRILGHSHVGEQPFTRSGGPVVVQGDTEIVVRAHLAPGGFGGQAFKGTVDGGLSAWAPSADFGAPLENTQPLPEDCAF